MRDDVACTTRRAPPRHYPEGHISHRRPPPRGQKYETMADFGRLGRLLDTPPSNVEALSLEDMSLIVREVGGHRATVVRSAQRASPQDDQEGVLRHAVREILTQRVRARRERVRGYQCSVVGCDQRAESPCGVCGCARFCSRQCQKESWKAKGACTGCRPHKDFCAAAAAVIRRLARRPEVRRAIERRDTGTGFYGKKATCYMLALAASDDCEGMKALPSLPRAAKVRANAFSTLLLAMISGL